MEPFWVLPKTNACKGNGIQIERDHLRDHQKTKAWEQSGPLKQNALTKTQEEQINIFMGPQKNLPKVPQEKESILNSY